MVNEARLAELLQEHPRLRDAGEALIAEANEAGGRDNITVILLRLEEVSAGGDAQTDGHTTLTRPLPATATAQASAPAAAQAPASAQPAAVAAASSSSFSPSIADAPATARVPRRPAGSAHPLAPSRRRWRRLGGALVVLAVLGVLLAGAYEASQSVYFIATNSRGLVTLYRGVPYELPGGVKLYNSDFVSGVSATMLSPQRRRTLLDHSLRSQGDAEGLMRSLELGELSQG
jgi:PPM family protein phosphatase